MSGPSGSGLGQIAQKGAGFAGVVRSLRQRKKEGGSSPSLPDRVGPSKGLPSTGLKRNTQEWKDKHKRPNERKRSGSKSTSSSILSSATASGSEDGDGGGSRVREHEGAEGRGPGKHERDLQNGHGQAQEQGQWTESPTEEEPSMQFLNKSRPPKDGDENVRTETRLANGHGGAHQEEGGNRKDAETNGHGEGNGADSEETMMGRNEGRNRKLTDEVGHMPDGLPGVKKEQAPGPRNEIVLDPRVSHMNVSSLCASESITDSTQYHQQREFTGKGVEKGPILMITPDGEEELPPGETPRASRQSSITNQAGESNGESSTKATEGTWMTAMNGQPTPARPKRLSGRFSSSVQSQVRRGEHEESESDQHDEPSSEVKEAAHQRWSHLRARVLPSRQTGSGTAPGPKKVTALAPTAVAAVPVTTELLAGQLPVMILKTWLDRDEDGNRAVPVLLGNLRFRVGDSVGLRAGRETGKEMFKVECEYGDGAVKWVSPQVWQS